MGCNHFEDRVLPPSQVGRQPGPPPFFTPDRNTLLRIRIILPIPPFELSQVALQGPPYKVTCSVSSVFCFHRILPVFPHPLGVRGCRPSPILSFQFLDVRGVSSLLYKFAACDYDSLRPPRVPSSTSASLSLLIFPLDVGGLFLSMALAESEPNPAGSSHSPCSHSQSYQ